MNHLPSADLRPPAPPTDPTLPDPGEAPVRRRNWGRVLAALTVASLSAVLALVWLSWSLPMSRALEPLPSPALVLVSADGHPFARRGAYKEAPVVAAALPAHVTGAFVAVEDRRFYHHLGVDLVGVARAALVNLRAGRVEEGGSTITQQLAKTSFLTPERSLRRKLQEVFIAVLLELRLSKDEILSRYLSSVYFGQGVYGLGAASRHYFDKPPERLTIAEAALLAGLVKAPSALNPVDQPKAAARRARLVLAAMEDTGAITAAQARAARPARVRPARTALPVGGYFADWVGPQAQSAFDTRYGEVRVATTLDSRLQRRGERSIRRLLDGRGKGLAAGQAALVAIRTDGAVVAMVGGRDYRTSQFNRVVQARRQPGSAFKLFVYLAALRDGASPDMVVDAGPITLGDWRPGNFDGETAGDLTLREAFAHSYNTAAVRISETAGRGAVVKAARDLGLTTPIAQDPTLALGTAETTLLELAAAYGAVAAGAAPVAPHGLPWPQGYAPPTRPLPAHERDGLMDLLHAAVAEGTGRAARLPQAVYGKTGTTQDHRDALFIGFTGDLVVGVWVGNDDHAPMRGVTGGGLPAEIWRDFVAGGIAAGEIPRGPREALREPPPEPVEPDKGVGGLLHRLFGNLFGA